MKIIISAVVIVAIAVMAALALRSDKKSPEQAGPEGSFVVAVLSPEVFVKSPDEQDFAKVEKEKSVGEGSAIKTSSSGRASVLYPNGTVVGIKESTGLVLADLDDSGNHSKIKLLVGGIRSKIENILGKGDFYQVETENMVASVRGTDFSVDFTNGVSEVEVFENEVEAQAINPKTGKFIEGAVIKLRAGEKIIIDSNNLPGPGNPLKKIQVNPTASPRPTATATPVPKPNPTPTPTPTPKPTLTSTSAQTTEPTPVQTSSIQSVSPKTIARNPDANVEFAINGKNLTGTKSVLLGQNSIGFFVLDSFTIFAKVGPNTEPGVYDVSVVTSAGETRTLYSALNVR